jgi:hypothetical protein
VRLQRVEALLGMDGRLVARGGDYDGWDLEVRAGGLSAVRVLLTIEEHGQGRQMVRFRARPSYRPAVLGTLAGLGACALLAVLDGAFVATGVLGTTAAALAVAAVRECGAAMATVRDGLDGETLD